MLDVTNLPQGDELAHFLEHAAALGRFADFFAKGSASDPVGNHCPVANGHVFAPRHGPLVWHGSLKSCPVKPINKSEILKAKITKQIRFLFSTFRFSPWRVVSIAQGQVHADLIVADAAADLRLAVEQLIKDLAVQVTKNFWPQD